MNPMRHSELVTECLELGREQFRAKYKGTMTNARIAGILNAAKNRQVSKLADSIKGMSGSTHQKVTELVFNGDVAPSVARRLLGVE